MTTLAWIAFRGDRQFDLYERHGLRKVGTAREESIQVAYSGFALPNGWRVLVLYHSLIPMRQFRRLGHVTEAKSLRDLSKNGEVVACEFTTVVMCAGAQKWRDGERTWLIEHNLEVDPGHLNVEGHLPSAFDRLQRCVMRRQRAEDDVDYIYELPALAAWLEVGFHFYKDFPKGREPELDILEPIKQPWWKFW